MPPLVVIRAMPLATWQHLMHPSHEGLMPHMHLQIYVRLLAVASEVTLTNQKAEEKAFLVVRKPRGHSDTGILVSP
jgi:hypothetical protein